MKKHIIIAVDLSEANAGIIKEAFAFASQLQAKVSLVSIISMYVDYLHSDMSLMPSQWEEIYDAQKKHAEKELTKIKEANNTLEIHIHTAIGNPKYDIITYAEETKADYIVMGTHGRTGLSHMMLGSTAEYVVRHSSIPVLIVPQKNKN
jgi:nucleotide-binding universal stress UspA family protein